MKKKLEAELISIAHRILKIKHKSDIVTLHQEVQKLYETLSVLRFIEENFGDIKPTIGINHVKQKIEDNFDTSTSVDTNLAEHEESTEETHEKADNTAVENDISCVQEPIDEEISEKEEIEKEEVEESKVEIVAEDGEKESNKTDLTENSDEKFEEEDHVEEVVIEEDLPKVEESPESEKTEESDEKSLFIPAFELAFDPKEPTVEPTPTVSTPQFTFDDLLGKDYSDPVFVKAEKVEPETPAAVEVEKEKVAPAKTVSEEVHHLSPEKEKRTFSVNDRLSKGITIGLNDRIAFMKHLFGNSSEDYNRVLSQLMTFDTFDEAEDFINDMVKPDYNNWDGKDEYSQRFLEIVERRFS